jgi:hypothetical protein
MANTSIEEEKKKLGRILRDTDQTRMVVRTVMNDGTLKAGGILPVVPNNNRRAEDGKRAGSFGFIPNAPGEMKEKPPQPLRMRGGIYVVTGNEIFVLDITPSDTSNIPEGRTAKRDANSTGD